MSVLERRWQNGAEGEHTGFLETLASQVAVGGSGTDKAKADQLGFEIEERRRERLKQLLELDRDVHLPQIIALGKKIDELIQVGLAKTTSVNPNTGVTQSLDHAQVFRLMAAEGRIGTAPLRQQRQGSTDRPCGGQFASSAPALPCPYPP